MSDESDRTESPQPDDPEAESRWITWRSAAAPPIPGPAAPQEATPPPVVRTPPVAVPPCRHAGLLLYGSGVVPGWGGGAR